MRLETHEETVDVVDATPHDVASIVASLTDPRAAFVVASHDAEGETYMQATGSVGEGFVVERRDGCAGEYYRADRRLSADELVVVLVGYARGDQGWARALSWHRVRVDGEAAEA